MDGARSADGVEDDVVGFAAAGDDDVDGGEVSLVGTGERETELLGGWDGGAMEGEGVEPAGVLKGLSYVVSV